MSPDDLAPMLATLGTLPPKNKDHEYAYEVKWDGIRALMYVEGGRIRLKGRRGTDITTRYPELRELGKALGATEVILDGEIVAFDEHGRPSFERLARRMHVTSESVIRRLVGQVPAVYVIFDLLSLDGHRTTSLPYEERRALLSQLDVRGPSWQTPAHHVGHGRALLDSTKELGLEGVVAKRLGCPYEPGKRVKHWIKVKHQLQQEFVIGGYLPGEGARAAHFGALLIGYYDDGKLRYAGRVGTGFTEQELARLRVLLQPLRRGTSPFDPTPPVKHAVFVEPRLVVEVRFTQWTSAGIVRNPAYLGLRDDVASAEVVREE